MSRLDYLSCGEFERPLAEQWAETERALRASGHPQEFILNYKAFWLRGAAATFNHLHHLYTLQPSVAVQGTTAARLFIEHECVVVQKAIEEMALLYDTPATNHQPI